jgi:hypothetical protein
MLIIGCDYHPGFQQIALVDTDTGELSQRRLLHHEEAEQFYRKLQEQGLKARAGDGIQRALALVRVVAAGVAV